MTGTGPHIELWHVAGCPLVEQVRADLRECLRRLGGGAIVTEREGPYPSPTVLINGVDVVTGAAPRGETCCRLDLPTRDQIRTALEVER